MSRQRWIRQRWIRQPWGRPFGGPHTGFVFALLFIGLHILSVTGYGQVTQPEPAAIEIRHGDIDREVAVQLQPHLKAGRDRVESFFGSKFPQPYGVEIHPKRAAFDAYFAQRWQLQNTEPWMVASGVSDRLTILSPRVWKTEAAEHDPADEQHIADLLAHELVHVYHGQHNPRPDFEGLDDLGWFVEGLAVFVSGQLERSHRNAAKEAIDAGKAPTELANVWSGRYRYGVSGSLVEFVATKYGKAKLIELLGATSNAQALQCLGTSEAELLADWKTAAVDSGGRPRE